MKPFHFLTLFVLVTAAAAVSCSPEESGGDGNGLVMVNASWTATSGTFGRVTRATLGDDLSIAWAEGDAISVFAGRTNYRVPSVSVDGNTAVFSGEVAESETYLAVYPYNADASSTGNHITTVFPASQELVANGADPAAIVAAARTSSGEMQFRNIVSLVGITFVRGEDEEVQTDLVDFYLTGGEDDRLSGRARYNTENGTFTPVTGSNRIDVSGDPQVGPAYYIAVMPGEYQSLTLTVTNADERSSDFVLEENTFSLEGNTVYEYTVDLSTGDWILRPPAGQSYTLIGATELEEFCDNPYDMREEVVDLVISGQDITDAHISDLYRRVSTVTGHFELNNVGVTSVSNLGYIEIQGGISLLNCSLLEDISWFDDATAIGGDLLVENCPALEQGFNSVQTVEGTLRLRNTSMRIGAGASFSALTSVGGNLEISDNDNQSLTSFRGASLTSVGQSIVIQDNPYLVSLEGLDNLTVIGGDVTIYDNGAIPELSGTGGNVGFCIIQEYRDFVISQMAAITLGPGEDGQPIDIEELRYCDGAAPGDPRSYTVTGRAELEEYISRAVAGGTRETVNNLTISGSDINADLIGRIDEWIYDVTGTLTLENLTFAGSEGESFNTESFLPALTHDNRFSGSIVFRNIPGSIYPNGFLNMYEIGGDLVIEDCPRFWTEQGWDGLRNIRRIEGDFRLVRSLMSLSGSAFASLEYVGGDFHAEDLTIWYFDGMDLTYIGGDLTISDNDQFWGLNGFENLTHVNNVTIMNYGELQMTSGPVSNVPWAVGLCLLREFRDEGVITGSVLISDDGNVTDIDDVPACDGTNPDPGQEDNMDGSGEAFDDPEDIIDWN